VKHVAGRIEQDGLAFFERRRDLARPFDRFLQPGLGNVRSNIPGSFFVLLARR
jgi:hypothetical protein